MTGSAQGRSLYKARRDLHGVRSTDGTIPDVRRVDDERDGQLRCAVWLDVEGGRRALEGAAVLRLP